MKRKTVYCQYIIKLGRRFLQKLREKCKLNSSISDNNFWSHGGIVIHCFVMLASTIAITVKALVELRPIHYYKPRYGSLLSLKITNL